MAAEEYDVVKPPQPVSDETIKRVEESFLVILKREGVKYKSKKYYEYQMIYFSGAIMALNIAIAS